VEFASGVTAEKLHREGHKGRQGRKKPHTKDAKDAKEESIT
jgi:hypothetical protein